VNSSSRLRKGLIIMEGLKAQDTTRVEERLAAFVTTQEGLTEAQQILDAADAKVKDARAVFEQCDLEQDHAVEMLARALVADGHPRTKPFAAFGGLPPGKLKALPPTEEARALHALVREIKRGKNISPTTLEAATAADQLATKLEMLPKNLSKLEAAANEARRVRDNWNREWDTSEAALRRLARLVEEDSGPALYSEGFGKRVRTVAKSPRASRPRKMTSETNAAAIGDATRANPPAPSSGQTT